MAERPRPAGYSGTPLAKKLGYREGTRALVREAPADYRKLLEPIPDGVQFETRLSEAVDLVHLFATRRAALAKALVTLRRGVRNDAMVWVSWPKRASNVPTDITEDTIRDEALPLGFVDVKVCAVSDVWSGLKLVVRKELR
ncbi:MAG TPA: DUF3052 family protein [Candidatus Polarisedimenticolia bacterium]|nr:DUF3052 family protein [Candidatus Polarisedimenticolia bacterium]